MEDNGEAGGRYPPSELPAKVVCNTETFLDYVSDSLWKRAEKARREPLATIVLNVVDPAYVIVFEHWVKMGLWRPVMTPGASKTGIKEFWSHKFEAGEALCRFEDLCDEAHHHDEHGRVVPYREAGGCLRVVGRGDLTCVGPPFYAAFRDHPFGPSKRMSRRAFSLRFSLMVVPASCAIDSDDEQGSHLKSGLALHHLYPSFTQRNIWLQPPPYKDPAQHFMRHVQRVVRLFDLDPMSVAVQAAKTWDCSTPDLFPDVFSYSQPMVDGHVWSERTENWVLVSGIRGKRERIGKSNKQIWYDRQRAALEAMRHYTHGSEPSEDANSDESYEISDDELEWWCRGPDVPDWALEEKRARMATRSSSRVASTLSPSAS